MGSFHFSFAASISFFRSLVVLARLRSIGIASVKVLLCRSRDRHLKQIQIDHVSLSRTSANSSVPRYDL
jgi:hypothetical protein